MPVDYGSPTSAIERSMQSSSRSLVTRVTELPSFSIAAILVAIRAISHRPAHVRFPRYRAPLSGRMLHMADENLSSYPSYQSVSARDWRPGHVLACRPCCMQALSNGERRGKRCRIQWGFTYALIVTLDRGIYLKMQHMLKFSFPPSPRRCGQTPVIAGKHKR